MFLLLPFVINAAAAIVDLYPVRWNPALGIPDTVCGRRCQPGDREVDASGDCFPPSGIAVLMVAVCQVFGAPHRPYMRREDQRRGNMTQAMDAIRQKVSPGDVIFVDFQTSFLLRFYLCPEISFTGLAACRLQRHFPAAAIA